MLSLTVILQTILVTYADKSLAGATQEQRFAPNLPHLLIWNEHLCKMTKRSNDIKFDGLSTKLDSISEKEKRGPAQKQLGGEGDGPNMERGINGGTSSKSCVPPGTKNKWSSEYHSEFTKIKMSRNIFQTERIYSPRYLQWKTLRLFLCSAFLGFGQFLNVHQWWNNYEHVIVRYMYLSIGFYST